MNDTTNVNTLNRHVVICNCNEKVKGIVEELQPEGHDDGLDIVLLVQDRALWEKNPHWHPKRHSKAVFEVIFGSPFEKEILQKAVIERARAAIILADPNHGQLADAQSTLMAVAIEKKNPQVHTVQELILSINRNHLKAMNVDEVVCLGEISEKLIAQSCITPGVKNIFENLLTTEKGTPQIFLSELPAGFNGMTFKEICKKCIRKNAPFIVIGYIVSSPDMLSDKGTANTIARTFVVNPRKKGKDMPLSRYDKIIVIAYTSPGELEWYLG